ncbi:MAG: glucosaminidase domain-containing protein [Flavobacteriales bacterium]|jgi:LysM repeat protein
MNRLFFLLFITGLRIAVAGTIDPKTGRYLITYQEIAIEQMEKYKIPASITMAQGMLESNYGESWLTKKSNNHFGIKCHASWTGEKTYADDDASQECFRVYPSGRESFEDHSLFLQKNKRYASLFTLNPKDYKGWAKGLQAAGYATNPSYAELLINLIEKNELFKLDEGKFPVSEGSIAKESDDHAKRPNTKPIVNEVLNHKNRVRYIVAAEGDTYYKISKRTGITLHQLHRYNETTDAVEALKKGELIYLDPKRIRSKEKESITLTKNTTLRTIAQQEALRLRPLMRRNHVSSADEQLPTGRKVFLR